MTLTLLSTYIIPAGNGKTHYIKKQLHGNQPYLVVVVNESFNPFSAIMKLRSLPRNATCKIFFNFTIVPLTVSINIYTAFYWLVAAATINFM